ncbi:MAG TPA: hypothetical protein VNF73_02910 [Candidatus Saccharimonadales bacterium]|nr:hypothetical protein [Candidatus Saccharimonadales bacterium]
MAVDAAAPITHIGHDRDRIARYLAARRRGTEWLLARLNADGSIGDPELGYKYYRAPWAFAATGEVVAAHAVAGWIRANLLTPDHRIDGPPRKLLDGWAYRDSALIVGAQMIHQYDLGIGILPSLLADMDPISGSIANDHLEDGSLSDDGDIPYACGVGFAALACGQIEPARKIAGFLRRIYDAQTELPASFFCFWSRSRQAPIRRDDPDFQLRMVVDNAVDRSQRWTIGGISAGFLCRLYLADPRPEYLELARRYQAFSMAATDAQFKYPAVCKSSWGGSLLYQVTGEALYRDWTYRMGDWYVDTQTPEGSWHPLVEENEADVIEVTLEFVMHLDTLIGALSSRP